MTRYLSIVVVIKNRTNFTIEYEGKTINLRLFDNNVRALFRLIQPDEIWELLVIDFNSTDVNMSEYLQELFKHNNKPNFTYTLHTINDPLFCKGKGLNIAKKMAKYSNVLFLDADMLIKSRTIIDNGYKHLSEGKVYFPICMSYKDKDHSSAKLRKSGTGNVFIHKVHLEQSSWGEYKQWGNEDTDFFNYFKSKMLVVRDNAGCTFFHQWHPDDMSFRNKYYLSDKQYNKNNVEPIVIKHTIKPTIKTYIDKLKIIKKPPTPPTPPTPVLSIPTQPPSPPPPTPIVTPIPPTPKQIIKNKKTVKPKIDSKPKIDIKKNVTEKLVESENKVVQSASEIKIEQPIIESDKVIINEKHTVSYAKKFKPLHNDYY